MSDGIVSGLLLSGVGAGAGALLGNLASRLGRHGRAKALAIAAAEAEATKIRSEAEAARQATLREAEIAAREHALGLRAAADVTLQSKQRELSRREADFTRREATVAGRARIVDEARAQLLERQEPIKALEAQKTQWLRSASELSAAARAALEQASGEKVAALRQTLLDAEREEARAQAAHILRLVDQGVNDPEQGRRAKRVMGIAIGRFSGHYLTERHMSTIFLGPPRDGQLIIPDADLRAIEAVANIKLTPLEAMDGVRLEGLDGVGKEVARRCLSWVLKRPSITGDAVSRMANEISGDLNREVADLGRQAFKVLEIQRAHPEIVSLVGRLNYRTSYTQNQWKHAVEVALLCGMMADEMGLDLKVARRAALMHDIGKALTHELDGSHAVIGADYARRLGESELVANAIGAHHTDEPFSSPYAYLVAAADALSGARPGARRMMEENYAAKLGDLERITRGFLGVSEAFAVQGGREVRVYVKQETMDDLAAVKLSTDIADTISREMTFPGQIRVTVIREFRAVETAN